MAVITSGSREYRGVHNHSLERVHLCQHYMLYSAVDRSGYYFAPLLELHYADPDLQGRPNRVRRAKKSQLQFLTYDDACAVRGVWFHMVAAVEFRHLPANCWACFEHRQSWNWTQLTTGVPLWLGASVCETCCHEPRCYICGIFSMLPCSAAATTSNYCGHCQSYTNPLHMLKCMLT